MSKDNIDALLKYLSEDENRKREHLPVMAVCLIMKTKLKNVQVGKYSSFVILHLKKHMQKKTCGAEKTSVEGTNLSDDIDGLHWEF